MSLWNIWILLKKKNNTIEEVMTKKFMEYVYVARIPKPRESPGLGLVSYVRLFNACLNFIKNGGKIPERSKLEESVESILESAHKESLGKRSCSLDETQKYPPENGEPFYDEVDFPEGGIILDEDDEDIYYGDEITPEEVDKLDLSSYFNPADDEAEIW